VTLEFSSTEPTDNAFIPWFNNKICAEYLNAPWASKTRGENARLGAEINKATNAESSCRSINGTWPAVIDNAGKSQHAVPRIRSSSVEHQKASPLNRRQKFGAGSSVQLLWGT
jgi:hypothetical protein